MRISDWSSDVCSSDLLDGIAVIAGDAGEEAQRIDARLRQMADQRAPAQDDRLAQRRLVMGSGSEMAVGAVVDCQAHARTPAVGERLRCVSGLSLCLHGQ